jgi:acyl-CoA thioester hydrolase
MNGLVPVPDGDRPDLTPYDLPTPHPFLARIVVGPEHLSRGVPHVSNVTTVGWLDRCAELHGDAVGQSRRALHDRGVMWFVASHLIEYAAELFEGDEVFVATWIEQLGRASAERLTWLLEPADGIVAVRARTRWVLVGLEHRRPIRIPEPMRAAYRGAERPSEDPTCTSG